MKNGFVIFLFWTLVTFFLFPLEIVSAENHDPKIASNEKNITQLSPKLRQALTQEMQSILGGMMALVPAISSGDWHEVAEIGKKIQGSYIMKQQLSEAQLEELHHSLPFEFKELDRSFHHAAGMLAHAAKKGNAEIVHFYFYKLNETCVKCHSRYATHRFPSFVTKAEQKTHPH